MTLTRLVFAWLPVALWFLVAPPFGQHRDAWAGRQHVAETYRRWAMTGRLLEALVVTLFASLWFDSLGSGEWWLLFLLVGLLVAYPLRWHSLAADEYRARAVVAGLLDAGRYVIAGAILAWRLG